MAGAGDSGARGDAPAPDDDRVRRVRELLDELSPQERQALLRAEDEPEEAGTGTEDSSGRAAKRGSKNSQEDVAGGASAAESEDEDESDAFYAGLEEDDDLIGSKLASRRAKRGKGENKDSESAPRRRAPLSSAERIALVAAVILGIAAAIWYSNVGGLSSGSPHGGAMASARAESTERGTGEWAEEISSLEAQIKADPTNLDLKIRLGEAYAGLGDYDRAIETIQGVADENPSKAEAWYDLGFLHLQTSSPDEAASKAAWQKVIDLDPDSELAGKARTHMDTLASQGAGQQGSAGMPPGHPAMPGSGATPAASSGNGQ